MNKYKIFTILLFLSVTNVFSQGKLTIFVRSIDSAQVLTNATVIVNGEKFYQKRSGYEKLLKKDTTYHLIIKHPNYPVRYVSFKFSGFDIKTVYVFKNNTSTFPCYEQIMPFKYDSKHIRIIGRHTPKLDSLIKELNLEIVSNSRQGIILLKKENGHRFKKYNCKILKILREADFSAGPVVGKKGIFTFRITIETENTPQEFEKIEKIAIKEGLVFENKTVMRRTKKVYYEFRAKLSIGYGIVDIANKLLKYPEIQYINTGLITLPNLY